MAIAFENELQQIDTSQEIEQLKEQRDRERDLYLRTLAEFDNYRRRVERERAKAAEAGKREILLSLLEVLDGFERAVGQMANMPESCLDGLGLLQRQLLNILKAQGVTPFSSVGEQFDPTLHEAVGTVRKDGYPTGTVANEERRGYRWGDQVLRPAQVHVAQ